MDERLNDPLVPLLPLLSMLSTFSCPPPSSSSVSLCPPVCFSVLLSPPVCFSVPLCPPLCSCFLMSSLLLSTPDFCLLVSPHVPSPLSLVSFSLSSCSLLLVSSVLSLYPPVSAVLCTVKRSVVYVVGSDRRRPCVIRISGRGTGGAL